MSASKYRGVQKNSRSRYNLYCGKKWKTQITYNGKCRTLIYTDDEEKAAREYDKWAKIFHGNKAKLNFPEEQNES